MSPGNDTRSGTPQTVKCSGFSLEQFEKLRHQFSHSLVTGRNAHRSTNTDSTVSKASKVGGLQKTLLYTLEGLPVAARGQCVTVLTIILVVIGIPVARANALDQGFAYLIAFAIAGLSWKGSDSVTWWPAALIARRI